MSGILRVARKRIIYPIELVDIDCHFPVLFRHGAVDCYLLSIDGSPNTLRNLIYGALGDRLTCRARSTSLPTNLLIYCRAGARLVLPQYVWWSGRYTLRLEIPFKVSVFCTSKRPCVWTISFRKFVEHVPHKHTAKQLKDSNILDDTL